MSLTTWRIAVVGAGPVGLALALLAAKLLPNAELTLFDARPLDRDVSGDARTLALSLGSVQLLDRLGVWPIAEAQPITEVHVSQTAPAFGSVHLRAADEGLALLGAVLPYGRLVTPLQQAWISVGTPHATRFGTPVRKLKALPEGIEVDAGIAEVYDLVVLAEGGVFGEQLSKPITHDYAQTAWVGTVELEGAPAGVAFERFTPRGPVALLPLGPGRAALVACLPDRDDPLRQLEGDRDAQRLFIAGQLPEAAGALISISALKPFALGLNAERTLVQGRRVVIGNAAQTLHPVAGQGLNLGLRDAYALVDALRFSEDLDDALRRVEWARAADRWATIATTDFLARSFTWKLPGMAPLRSLALAALDATPPAKRWLARQMMFGVR